MPMLQHHVAVVGGGLAGIVTAKALKCRGIQFTVFERQSRVGGLWVSAYPNAHVQAPKHLYEFPEMRFAEGTSTYPTAQEVVEYAEQFVAQFELADSIRLNTSVRIITRDPCSAGFIIEYADAAGAVKQGRFSFVVICNGLCSNRPHIPDLPGQKAFAGTILHTSQWQKPEMFTGQNVIIVGNGKSASDAAMTASRFAKRTVQVVRTRHWYIPRHLGSLVPYEFAFHNRLIPSLLPLYPGVSSLFQAAHAALAPLRWMVWRLLEMGLLLQYRWPPELWPTEPFERDILGGPPLIASPELLAAIRSRAFDMRVGMVAAVNERSVTLTDGTTYDADIIVLGTGWKMGAECLQGDVTEVLEIGDDGLYLYRNMVCPSLPRLAFVGANVLTFMNPYTHSLQAAWLASYICGDFAMPSVAEMEAEVERVKAKKRQSYPKSLVRGALVEGHLQQYHDELIADLGEEPGRFTGVFGPIANLVMPVYPYQMDDVVRPKRAKTGAKFAPPVALEMLLVCVFAWTVLAVLHMVW